MNVTPAPPAAMPADVNESMDRRVWGLGLGLVLAFFFCYADVLSGMIRQWWNISFYSYAFLIPAVSAYLVWIRRDQLWAVHPTPSRWGGICTITAGLLVLMIGRVGGIQAFQQISLLITLPGIVLLLFGWQVLKALSLPIGFLWFMLPIWEVLTDQLHSPFQLLSANIGVRLLQVFGIPVYQEGVLIYLPNITLEVARACSGVNYLIAVLATSIPLATIVLNDIRKRIGLVVLAVTVSALANSLRVALIGVLAYYDLSGDLHGPYHTLHGMFVSLIGYVVIFAGLWVLSRKQEPAVRPAVQHIWRLEWSHVRTAWVVLAVVFVAVGVSRYVDRSNPVPLRQNLSGFSLEHIAWIGRDTAPVEFLPGADGTLSRSFRALSGEEVTLSLWYFENQSQGKELVNPATAKMHAGSRKVTLNAGSRGMIHVNRRILHDGGKKQALVFWYDLNGRVLDSPQEVKFRTALEAVAYGRTNGALVQMAVDLVSEDQDGIERAMAQLGTFIDHAYPVLDRYLPRSGQ
jgi:EpsI family protein